MSCSCLVRKSKLDWVNVKQFDRDWLEIHWDQPEPRLLGMARKVVWLLVSPNLSGMPRTKNLPRLGFPNGSVWSVL